MAINKLGKLYVLLLLIIAILSFSSGVSGHKVAGNFGTSTDTALEQRLAALMKQHPGQRHPSLTYNAILARVARQRAYDMGQRNYFNHVNPEGIGPNYLVTRAGYVLPDFYGKDRTSNSIESIVAGNETAEEAWDNWMDSSGHREHLLGLTRFYAEQTEYGVGHAFVPESRYKHYWVVIIAKSGESNESPTNVSSDSDDVDSFDSEAESSSTCPNVIRTSNGKLRPASGYVWVNDDPNDLRVKLMPGLIRTDDGCLRPARGYTWVNPKDPRDLRVTPIQ